ncbi:MAG: oligosaccharide flippase family protein [Minicystis sp.]
MVQSSETEGAAPGAPAADGATARAAGRGGLAITGAKAAFILFGLAQQLVLPRLVGVDGYGQVALVLSIVSIVNNVIVATSIQGVSRAVSSAPAGREDQAFRATLRIHVILAMSVSLVFALLAGTIAAIEGAPHVTGPLRLVGLIVLLYGVYAPLVGSLNGRRLFVAQAALDTGYGALRMVGVALGAALFVRAGANGVLGSFIGFVIAAAIIVPFALAKSGLGRAGEGGPSAREYLSFLLPLAGGQIFLNLLMQTDFLLLRRFAGEVAASPQAADSLQGVYRGVQLFSFLPYQLLMSVTFILFPMLARAHAYNDRAAVRGYTMTGVRLALVLTALMTGAVAGTAPHLLRLVFPEEIWTRGGDALRILSVGMGAFSVLGITCAALTSLGRERESALLTLTAVLLVAAGCSYLVPRAAFGPEMLVKSALATSAALTAAAVVGGIRLAAVAGGFAAPATIARVLASLVVCVLAGSRLPWIGKAGVVVEAGAVFVLGLVVLIALGEVGKQDLARIKQVAGKKG